MNKLNFLRSEILKTLETEFNKSDFNLNKKLGEFSKATQGGWVKYQIIFLEKNDAWELNPAMLIRKDAVENIFHKISNFEQKYQKGTPTIGTSIEDYLNKKNEYRFWLSEESHIDEVALSVANLFYQVAIPFFEKYSDLKSIEYEINSNPLNMSLTGPIFKGFKGTILAWILKNNNYGELISIYSQHYKTFADGFYFSEYECLLTMLQKTET